MRTGSSHATRRECPRDTEATLTLYLRRAERLTNPDAKGVTLVEGDVLDLPTLEAAMKAQDVIYASLAGNMKAQAEHIVDAMHATGVKRLIFISSMGIYGEVPGERYRSALDPNRNSAAVIEASDLDYTILRPGVVHPRRRGELSGHAEARAVPWARRVT